VELGKLLPPGGGAPAQVSQVHPVTGPRRAPLGSLTKRLRDEGYTISVERPRIEWFGDSPELARELGDLVRRGVKTASAGLLASWEADGEPLPGVGDVEIIVDRVGEPVAVVEVTEVRVVPFDQVDEAFASDEGEGDRSLASWRDAHWRYFSRECTRLGGEPTGTMPVVCRRFRLLHAVGRRGGARA
jgi:uncharacterized protein YhfF